jgi:lysyl-tRNA synthetase class I
MITTVTQIKQPPARDVYLFFRNCLNARHRPNDVATTEDELKERQKIAKEYFEKIVEPHFKIRKKYYQALEALEIHLMVFTDAMMHNPDDVDDIKSMLNSADIKAPQESFFDKIFK